MCDVDSMKPLRRVRWSYKVLVWRDVRFILCELQYYFGFKNTVAHRTILFKLWDAAH